MNRLAQSILPSYSNEEGVCYGIDLYWSAEGIQEEFKRISAFAEVKSHSTTPNAFEQSAAEFGDPFGNILGIRAKDLKGENKAQIRRAAERVALKNVRAAIDQFMAAEEKQKKVNIQPGAWHPACSGTLVFCNKLKRRMPVAAAKRC